MTTSLQHPEHAAVVAARTDVQRAVAVEAVRNALAAAEALKGIVITDDETAAIAVDQAGTVKRGLDALKAEVKRVLEVPKAMEAAVREVSNPTIALLDAALRDSGAARIRYQDAKDAEARREVERQKAEAERLRLEAAAEADLLGEDAPPPVVFSQAPPPKPVVPQGATAQQIITKKLTCELVNPLEADPTWLVLAGTTRPVDDFKAQMNLGNVREPGTREHPVEWKGCRFWYQRGVQNRGAR